MIYIVSTFILIFSKELLPLNQELLIITGFLIMFFMIKKLINNPIANTLDDYRNQIKTIYLQGINKKIANVTSKIVGLIDKNEELHSTGDYILDIENNVNETLLVSANTTFQSSVNNIAQEMAKTTDSRRSNLIF